jgi:hypothetical protein
MGRRGHRGTMTTLAVGANGRMLVGSVEGTPFFWLADTAWRLFDLSPADIDHYLRDRTDSRTHSQQAEPNHQPFIKSAGKVFPALSICPDRSGRPTGY